MDGLVYQRTGKHLDDVQKGVVEGTYQGETYSEMGENNNFHTNHLSDVGGDLWKLLSEILGEDIKKSNFRSTIERIYIKSSQNQHICHVTGTNHSCNYSPQIVLSSKENNQQDSNFNQSKSSYYDLTLAPQIIKFYNRETELQTLYDWRFNQNTPLISVLGLSGMGKTALVKRFVDLNLEQFEVIIWKNLQFPQSLDLLINDLLNTCQQETQKTIQANLKQLFDIFTEKKCLIILDDVQNLFITGQLSGQYQPEYKDYQKFFKMITETIHQSNVILISQEQCAEINFLDPQLYPIKYLELLSLDDIKILENTGLNHPDSWLHLIQLYEGNPIYLKDVTSLIRDVYDGEVDDFLTENSLVITQNMQAHFHHLFNRLSPSEQQIILELSQLDQPRSREDLKQNLT